MTVRALATSFSNALKLMTTMVIYSMVGAFVAIGATSLMGLNSPIHIATLKIEGGSTVNFTRTTVGELVRREEDRPPKVDPVAAIKPKAVVPAKPVVKKPVSKKKAVKKVKESERSSRRSSQPQQNTDGPGNGNGNPPGGGGSSGGGLGGVVGGIGDAVGGAVGGIGGAVGGALGGDR